MIKCEQGRAGNFYLQLHWLQSQKISQIAFVCDNCNTGSCIASKSRELLMPTISAFYGLVIQMFFMDHAPPHFHAKYGEHKAVIDIQGLKVINGTLPPRALNLAVDWAKLHQTELLDDWRLCQEMQHPKPIAPLE